MIENKGCWKIFYINGKPIRREEDLQVLFRLVWFGTILDVRREVDDGRGYADYKISYGKDKTLVEFKLASNKKLKTQLQHQLELYKLASDAEHGYKVILYFTTDELISLNRILTELKMLKDPNIMLIDARVKASASRVR